MLPMEVDGVSAGFGELVSGEGGIGLVCVGSIREYMRLWKSCVMSGVIMLSIGSGNEDVRQRGISSGCGRCPWASSYEWTN